MNLKRRLRSAWNAFCDPMETDSSTLKHLWLRGEFALLSVDLFDGHLIPRVTMLDHRTQDDIKRQYSICVP